MCKIHKSESLKNLMHLLKIYYVIPLSSCEPERIFSAMNRIKTDLRNPLETETLDNFLMISRNGEEINNFNYELAFDSWKKEKKRYFL